MKTIVVSGLARCGSSLTMQMLHAGGLRCAAEPPAFEDVDRFGLGCSVSWKLLQRYQAVKIIEPHLIKIAPGADVAVIWLRRNPFEQARSQIKLVKALAADVPSNAETVSRITQGILSDTVKAMAALKPCSRATLVLKFEELVGPERFAAAQKIADFVYATLHVQLPVATMAARILPRGPECEPALAIESLLIRERNKPTCLFPR
jgi:hypothetical protein